MSTKQNWMKKKIIASKQYQYKAFDEINDLVIVNRKGKEIELDCGNRLIEFVSCSYLGLDQDIRLIESAINSNMKNFGVAFHSARTRIQPKPYIDLESLLGNIYCEASPVVFPSIHMAHLGVFPIIGSGEMPNFPSDKNGFRFILDKTVHASVQINRGLLSQFGDVISIDFNKRDLLENIFKLAKIENITPVAIADSVGSMGGVAPIKFLLELSESYDGYVYLDDAHGTSVHGQHGSGYVFKTLGYNLHPRLILVSSLGKGFGVLGGVLLFKNKEDADFTKRFAPTYVFGGPPGLSLINSAIASAKIHLSDEIYTLQNSLWNNVNYFDVLLHNHTVNKNTPSPIRGIFIGNENKAIEISIKLKNRGFIVTTAMYPTVKKNCSMLRIALSASHTKQQILSLCENIKDIMSMSDFSG